MKLTIKDNHAPALFLIGALVANHSVFRLGAMPFAWVPALLILTAAVALIVPHLDIPGPDRTPLNRWNILAGLIILFPAFASLILGWNREFPFSGDQSFHVKQIYYMTYWWAQPIGTPSVGILGRTLGYEDFYQLLAHPARLLWSRAVIVIIILIGTWLCYRRKPALAVAFSAIAFVIWGSFEQSIYLRYPGAGYVLDQLFALPGILSGQVELSGRITNVAAVAVWLFLLRPILLKKWPDLSILPAALFVFWQKDLLYFIDSTYLESWPFVLTFLAVELVVERGRTGVPLACLLVGAAACFKEPFIIAIPLVWLAGIFPWRSFADSFRVSVFAFVGGFPFLFYYFCRKNVPLTDIIIDRTYDYSFEFKTLVSYMAHFFDRMVSNFADLGLIAAVLAIAAIPFMAIRRRGRWFQLICLAAACLELVLFFALDEVSHFWAGYFRFFIPAFAFMSCGLMAAGHFLPRRQVLIVSVAMLALQGHSAYVAVARSAGPGSERNFVEHYESALVFPMKWLLGQARNAGYLPANTVVLANQPDETVRSLPKVDVQFGPLGQLFCSCNDQHPNVMALFVRYTNLSAPYSARPPVNGEYGPPEPRDTLWRKNIAEAPACLAQMRRTCAHVIERNEGGVLVGAIGTR